MGKIQVNVIRGVANINGNAYPMYSGFLNSEFLRKLASVPSFNKDKEHFKIARDIFTPPVDEWQRPLDEGKKRDIGATYSKTDHDNLMANPVLLGMSSTSINQKAFIEIKKRTVNLQGGSLLEIEDIYTIDIYYDDDNKPLWILDGQHRIEGMYNSSQRKQPMPFVMLYGEIYEPKYLAEIFTQVTATATPMKDLHSQWMQYAFDLGNYVYPNHKYALQVVIYLCKETSFDGVINPFHNKIQFNPYSAITGYYAFELNMKEWEDIIANEYYSNGGTFNPKELANEIVKAVKSFEELDAAKHTTSKIFSNNSPFKSLAEGFLTGLLRYLAINNTKMSFTEWGSFYRDPKRNLNKCNWTMSFVKTAGSLSSSNGIPSKNIAKNCFDVVFNRPEDLEGANLTDYLYGVNSTIRITAYQKTPSGTKSTKNPYVKIFEPKGLVPFDLNHDGIQREIIDIESNSPNTYVQKVQDPNHKVAEELKMKGLDVSGYNNAYEIEILTLNYSGDTLKVTTLRLDR